MKEVITQKVDLVILLLDTTTGRVVDVPMVKFFDEKGEEMNFQARGGGIYLFLNTGPIKESIDLRVRGYEPLKVAINTEELDEKLPMRIVYLIPSEDTFQIDSYLTLRGKLPGLQSISLLIRGDVITTTDAYNPKQKLLTVLSKGYRLNTEGSPYGILNADGSEFEMFEVVEQVHTAGVILKEPLEGEFLRNVPIGRVIFGYVYPDGSFLLRLRERTQLKTLIRYVVGGEVKFIEADFNNPEEFKLQ